MIISLWWLWAILMVVAPIAISLLSAIIVGWVFNSSGEGVAGCMIWAMMVVSWFVFFVLFLVSVIRSFLY